MATYEESESLNEETRASLWQRMGTASLTTLVELSTKPPYDTWSHLKVFAAQQLNKVAELGVK